MIEFEQCWGETVETGIRGIKKCLPLRYWMKNLSDVIMSSFVPSQGRPWCFGKVLSLPLSYPHKKHCFFFPWLPRVIYAVFKRPLVEVTCNYILSFEVLATIPNFLSPASLINRSVISLSQNERNLIFLELRHWLNVPEDIYDVDFQK